MLFLRRANYIRYFLTIAFFLATFIVFFLLLKTSTAVIVLDARLSDYKQHQIKQFFSEKKFSYVAHKLLSALAQELPVIQDISIRRLGSLKAKVHAQAFDPLYRVQNISTHKEFIMTCNNLVDGTDYIAQATAHLPVLYIDTQKNALHEATFIDTMLRLPANLLDTYIITYKNKTEIVLYSKKQSFVIIADYKTLQDQNKIIYAELLAEKKYIKGVTIDIRFAHGAVCSPKGR